MVRIVEPAAQMLHAKIHQVVLSELEMHEVIVLAHDSVRNYFRAVLAKAAVDKLQHSLFGVENCVLPEL